MLNDTLIESAKRVDLLVLARRDNNLHKLSAGEWAGACPRCGGSDRLHVRADAWMCRQCHPRWSDLIGYLRWLEPGLSFADAVKRLTDTTITTIGSQQLAQQSLCKPRRQSIMQDKPEWANKAAVTLKDSQNRLLEPEGEPGREYLASRGLQPRTWSQFGLGFRLDVSVPGTQGRQKAPGIAIPWFTAGKLTALRYRFLEEQNGHKLTAEAGSLFAGRLFASQGLPDWVRPTDSDGRFERLCSLVIVEGEFNAMSIWQTAGHTNLHTLSLGSESAKLSDATVAFAKRYRHVIVWADKSQVTRSLQVSLPGAHSITSPNGKDANDLLRSGLLGAFLGLARLRACHDDDERQALLWDLWDGAQSWPGVDAGTMQVIRHIADGLGKTLKEGI